MRSERTNTDQDASPRERQDEHKVPAKPPVREEYPGPQETSTGERVEPGTAKVRKDSAEERAERRRGSS